MTLCHKKLLTAKSAKIALNGRERRGFAEIVEEFGLISF